MTTDAVERFMNLYRNASELAPEAIAEVYSPGIVFVDPIHRIEGIDALQKYLNVMYGNVHSCQFEYHDQIVEEHKASIKWNMRFRHRKLARGQEIEVRGATFIEYGDRVLLHEDFFDVGSMMYEHVPVLGAGIRYLKRRIS